MYYLSQADGMGEWRTKEAKDLSDLVQNRITYLQVPAAQPTGLARSLTHTHTHTHSHRMYCRHKHTVSIDLNASLTGTTAHMRCWGHVSHLLVSFAPNVTVGCSFQKEQVMGVRADCHSSWIWQAGFWLLVSDLVTHTHTHTHTWQKTDTHADLQKWQIGRRASYLPERRWMHICLQHTTHILRPVTHPFTPSRPESPPPALVLTGSRGTGPCSINEPVCVWWRGPSQSGWAETAPLTAAVTNVEGSHRSTSCCH